VWPSHQSYRSFTTFISCVHSSSTPCLHTFTNDDSGRICTAATPGMRSGNSVACAGDREEEQNMHLCVQVAELLKRAHYPEGRASLATIEAACAAAAPDAW
jgi:hypothetical protein